MNERDAPDPDLGEANPPGIHAATLKRIDHCRAEPIVSTQDISDPRNQDPIH
jgi:hypothetical protein